MAVRGRRVMVAAGCSAAVATPSGQWEGRRVLNTSRGDDEGDGVAPKRAAAESRSHERASGLGLFALSKGQTRDSRTREGS